MIKFILWLAAIELAGTLITIIIFGLGGIPIKHLLKTAWLWPGFIIMFIGLLFKKNDDK